MKKIGLPFWKVGDNSFGSTVPYLMFAERFGEVVPLMPKHTIRKDLDLLILPGGADVDPLRYSEVPSYFTGKPDLYKEYFDEHYLPSYIDNGTPILAICRGYQSLYVTFGGTLIQHMFHETNDMAKDPYKAVHDIIFTKNFATSNLDKFTNKRALGVNSRHHQAINSDSLPEGIVPLAYHSPFNKKEGTDGTIEMYAHAEYPIVGMQFHPEDCYETDTMIFINNIVKTLIDSKESIVVAAKEEAVA